MSRANTSNHRGLPSTARIAGLVLSTAALCMNATAQEQEQEQEQARAAWPMAFAGERTLPELENAFWVCDYKATASGIVDAGTAIACGVATEGLRTRKFGGDFHAMLSWWRQNKAAAYRELERAHRAAAHR